MDCAARAHQRRARVGAVREEHHQGPVRQVVDDVAQQVHRGRVGPVEILDDDQERTLLQPPLDQRARGQRDLALELLGLEVARPRLLDAEHVAQHRRDGLRHLGRRSERPQARRQLLPRDLERVVGVDLVGFAEERAEDAVGGLAQRRAGGPADRRAGEPAVGLEPRSGTRRSAATCPCRPRRPGSRPGPGPRCMRSKAARSWSSSSARPTIGAASPCAASPRADRGSASAPSRRWTTIGSALPRSVSSPAGSNAKRCRVRAWVASDTRIVPGAAAARRRAVVFTVSPVTA